MPLSLDEEIRYSRHLMLPGVGLAGQQRLQQSRVLVVGAGGLGSPIALYLAAAGVGTLGIIDADVVDVTNLQRQILHGTADVGKPKVESAANTLAAINPQITINPIAERLSSANALSLIADYDLVIDGTDNFPTRYLLNDACAFQRKPLVFGSIYRFEGQITVFDVRQGPCYRCLFPEPPPPESVPSCAEGGVLGVLPGIIGTAQATEAIKLLLGIGEPLIGRLLMYDALTMRFRELAIEKNPDCPLCGESPTITALMDYEEFCGIPGFYQHSDEWEISPAQCAEWMQTGIRLVDVRPDWEIDDLPGLPGALAIPYHDLTRRMAELDSATDIVMYCSNGSRSWQATRLLRQAGYTRVWNLRGGLWAYRMLV